MLCCAIVNDSKASGIWSEYKTVVSSRVPSICCDHMPFSPDLQNDGWLRKLWLGASGVVKTQLGTTMVVIDSRLSGGKH